MIDNLSTVSIVWTGTIHVIFIANIFHSPAILKVNTHIGTIGLQSENKNSMKTYLITIWDRLILDVDTSKFIFNYSQDFLKKSNMISINFSIGGGLIFDIFTWLSTSALDGRSLICPVQRVTATWRANTANNQSWTDYWARFCRQASRGS